MEKKRGLLSGTATLALLSLLRCWMDLGGPVCGAVHRAGSQPRVSAGTLASSIRHGRSPDFPAAAWRPWLGIVFPERSIGGCGGVCRINPSGGGLSCQVVGLQRLAVECGWAGLFGQHRRLRDCGVGIGSVSGSGIGTECGMSAIPGPGSCLPDAVRAVRTRYGYCAGHAPCGGGD